MSFPKLGYFLKPISTSGTIKNTVAVEPSEGLYPGYSASGQDVWVDYYDFDGDALVISAVGARCGKTFRASGKWGAIANTSAVRLLGGDLKFFWYLTNQPHFWEIGGAAQPYVKVSESLQKRFFIPKLEDQIAIVGHLDRETGLIDGLIEKKTRFIAVLDEKEKSMIAHYVRRGIDASAPTTDSGVEWRGIVPTDWQRARMKNHFKQVKRQGYDDLTVLSVYREFGVIEKASRSDNINKTPEDLSKYQLVEPNDLAINKMKAWQGSMGISPFLGITSPDYVVMKPIGEHNPRYMHHYLRARPMPWVYRLISNGIRTDQWRMEPEKFLELPIFLPPLEEQEAIANRIDRELDRIRGLIEKTERSIALLKEKRAALITAAVTGKIDVRAAA